MPTQEQRAAALVKIGFMPESAYALAQLADSYEEAELDDFALLDLAEMTDEDRSRVQAFVLYAPLVPDWMRKLWGADVVKEMREHEGLGYRAE